VDDFVGDAEFLEGAGVPPAIENLRPPASGLENPMARKAGRLHYIANVQMKADLGINRPGQKTLCTGFFKLRFISFSS
jgi:hypothetical protein